MNKTRYWWIFPIAFYIGVHLPTWVNNLCIYPDISLSYCLDFLVDDSLFPDDLFGRYELEFLGEHINASKWYYVFSFNWFYGVLLICNRFVDLLLLLKISNFLGFLLCIRVLHKIFSTRLNINLFMILFSMLFLSMDVFQGGLHRVWGFLVFLLFLHSYIENKRWRSFLFIILQGMVYPQVLPVQFAMFLVQHRIDHKPISHYLKSYLSVIILGFLLLIAYIYGGSYQSQVFKFPEARLNFSNYKTIIEGVNPVEIVVQYILNAEDHSRLYLYLISSLTLITLAGYKRLKPIFFTDRVLIGFLISSAIWLAFTALLGAFMNELTFFLHIGAKPIKWTGPLCLVYFTALIFNRWCTHSFRLILVFCGIFAGYMMVFKADTIDFSPYRNVLNEIRNVPKESVILGDPAFCDVVPIYCKRQVYSMYIWDEVASSHKFYMEINRRKNELNQLKLMVGKKQFVEWCKNEGITHFVLDKKHSLLSDVLEKQLTPYNEKRLTLITIEQLVS